jgi:hypothetical protein
VCAGFFSGQGTADGSPGILSLSKQLLMNGQLSGVPFSIFKELNQLPSGFPFHLKVRL